MLLVAYVVGVVTIAVTWGSVLRGELPDDATSEDRRLVDQVRGAADMAPVPTVLIMAVGAVSWPALLIVTGLNSLFGRPKR